MPTPYTPDQSLVDAKEALPMEAQVRIERAIGPAGQALIALGNIFHLTPSELKLAARIVADCLGTNEEIDALDTPEEPTNVNG